MPRKPLRSSCMTPGVLGADGRLRVVSAFNVRHAMRLACWYGPASYIPMGFGLKPQNDSSSPLTPQERKCWAKLKRFGYRRVTVSHKVVV